MDNIATIISDLKFGRSQLLKSIDGLSHRELTETLIYEEWTIKDVMAHVIGWDRRVIKTLPLMLQDRADEIPGVDVEAFNRQSVEACRDKTLAEVLADIKSTHRQILEILAEVDHVEIDTRRVRYGRTITIRSYVIDVMMEHEREHATEIEQWRKGLAQAIDPSSIKAALAQNRADFWAALTGLNETDLLDKSALDGWSVKELVGHIADWEQFILNAARHIYDPARPTLPPVDDSLEHRHRMLAARRKGNTWPEEARSLRECQAALDEFIARLNPGDWKLRGPYPWPSDQGALAELLTHAAEHYTDHLPAVTRWRREKLSERPPAKPWVRWIFDGDAAGPLKKEYDAAVKRAGRVWNIVRAMSLNPVALTGIDGAVWRGGSSLYRAVGPARARNDRRGGLSGQRCPLLNSISFVRPPG